MINNEIIGLAESLALNHQGKSGGGDPLVAFKDYEVTFVEEDFGDSFEGLIRFKDSEYQVFVNKGKANGKARTAGRKNFTAAHEFAHFSIEEHRTAIRIGEGVHKSKSGFQSRLPMEREADIFASHFLIPTTKLLKFCGKGNWGAKEILGVANHFRTSITCAALRCQATLSGNCTLVLWGDDGVRWQRMNRDWWFELPAKSIRNNDELAKGSATERLLNNKECTDGRGFLQTGTTRAAWFSRIKEWSHTNDILIEEAIPLGTYGVLTLLRPDSH